MRARPNPAARYMAVDRGRLAWGYRALPVPRCLGSRYALWRGRTRTPCAAHTKLGANPGLAVCANARVAATTRALPAIGLTIRGRARGGAALRTSRTNRYARNGARDTTTLIGPCVAGCTRILRSCVRQVLNSQLREWANQHRA